MHTPSTRILSALAYDFGREYDPTDPVCQALTDAVMQSEHATRDRRRRRPVREGPAAPARARPRAGGDPGLVLGRGPDRRAVGDRRRAVLLIDRRDGSGAPASDARAAQSRPVAGPHTFTTTTSKGGHMSHDHLDHPGRRGARRHARVPRRQPHRRRLPGADRARPREGARAAQHRAPGPDPGRRQRTRRSRWSTRSAPARGSPAGSIPTSPLIVLSRDADRLQRIRVLERGGDDVVKQAVRLPGAARPDRRGAAALGDAAVGADPARGADRDRRALARGARVRPAGRAVGQGVRPAGHARRRADEGVHPRGADARHLGPADVRAHPDARQPRLSGCAASCAPTATTGW